MTVFTVIPGGSSPCDEKYLDVYGLLKEESEKLGYHFDILYMPGQRKKDRHLSGRYGLEACIDTVREQILSLERGRFPYTVMALSGGCTVLLSTLIELGNEKVSLHKLQKVILYGAAPFSLFWKIFSKGEGLDKVGSSTKFASNFWEEWQPVEYLLPLVQYKTLVAVGTIDKYVPISFFEYLKNICELNQNVSFAIVDRCGHNVKKSDDQNWQAYIEAILEPPPITYELRKQKIIDEDSVADFSGF